MNRRGSQTARPSRQPSNRKDTPIRDARDAAYRHLSAHAGRFPDLIPSEINTGGLEPRDASLAHAIVDASILRWRSLEFVLESLSGHRSHEIEPRLRAVLLGGAAQLLLLDRVPPHAILDESVAWAKRHIRPGAGGMVNAILRKVSRARGEVIMEPWSHHIDAIPLSDGGMLRLNGIDLPEHGRRRLGIACSLPNALLERWESMYEDPTEAALHTICRAPTLLYVHHAQQQPARPSLSPHESAQHLVFSGPRTELIEILAEHPDVWVQDPASSATLGNLELSNAPERIIDLCAGQGTKTRQLRAMFPSSEIIASEVDPQRLRALRAQFEADSLVSVVPVAELTTDYAATADLILTDVPCSNTGVLPRRLEARYRPINTQIKRLIETQREILQHAKVLLSPGGNVVYSTCSAEVEENEANADWASKQLGLRLASLSRVEPQGLPGDQPSRYRDGSFAAHLTLEG
ncbi:MAG: transcription antitermination factor NusB [Phycisphaerales bacterium]